MNPKNRDNELDNINFDDFELEDLSFDVEIKPEENSKISLELKPDSSSTSQMTFDNKSEDSESAETLSLDDDKQEESDENDNNNDAVNSDESSSQGMEDGESISELPQDGEETDNSDDLSHDDRNLREKARDLKDNLKQTKDDIKNLPQNLKEKAGQAKDRVNKTKDNIKNLPENARNKGRELKDRANRAKDNIKNFPKNKDQLKNRLSNSAKRAKNSAKNAANKAIDRGKEGLKDRVENSKPVQAAKKAKDVYDKSKKAAATAKKAGKAVGKAGKAAGKAASKGINSLIGLILKTAPYSLIAIGIILLIILIVVIIIAVFPGKLNVNSEIEAQNYSETDLKTLGKLRSLHEKYPNADAALAMVTVIYPFYDTLQSNSVKYYINSSESTLDSNESYEDEEDEDVTEDSDDKEDCTGEECDVKVEDDAYLEYFRQYKYRRKYKYLLKKLSGKSTDDIKQFLKDKYFNDNGEYRKMFALVDDDKKDDFANAIIDDLFDLKENFTNYVYENSICSSTSVSLGYSDGSDLIKGEAYVVLKDTSSSNFNDIKNAATLYGTDNYDLDLKRYTMGVAYCEVGGYIDNEEYAKVAMIAAKSFVLARASNSKAGMGYKTEQLDNKTIFYMRNNSYDQGFCDVYEGCQSNSKYAHSLIQHDPTGEITRNVKGPLAQDKIDKLSKWYDETASEFIYDDESKGYYSAYLADNYGTYCPKGACLLQNRAYKDAQNGTGYQAILKKYYSDNKYVIKNIETNSLSEVSISCTEVSDKKCTIPDNEFVYYSQRSYKNHFCGRSDSSTISSSGCGITSMAMVLANLVDKSINPITTMNEAMESKNCGDGIAGTKASYFEVASKKYGLNYSSLAASDASSSADSKIINTLNSGGLIIANVGSNWSTVTTGHYLVIKGITADNKLIIADPMTNKVDNPWKNYITISDMRSYMIGRYFYLFTGGNSNQIKEKYCKVSEKGTLSSPFGLDDTEQYDDKGNARCFPNYCSGSPHGALDIRKDEGTPIYAMDGGKISLVGNYGYNCNNSEACNKGWNSYGIYVEINHENGYKTVYAHLSKRLVNVGDTVEKGQLIGLSGDTGNSTGAHLHIELQNTALYTKNGRSVAKSGKGLGLMNPANYINKNISYVGKSE